MKVQNEQIQRSRMDIPQPIYHSNRNSYGYLLAASFGGLVVLWGLWYVSGLLVHVLFILLAVILFLVSVAHFGHVLWHKNASMYWARKELEFSRHFYANGESIIGDETTLNYRLFHPNILQPEIKDEFPTVESYPPDTYDQLKDREIFNMKKAGKTWEEIRLSFDEQIRPSLQTCRTAFKNHEKRIKNGETYE